MWLSIQLDQNPNDPSLLPILNGDKMTVKLKQLHFLDGEPQTFGFERYEN